MTRYERLRNQRSHIWRKRRRQHNDRRQQHRFLANNRYKTQQGTNVDTLVQKLSLLDRVMAAVVKALKQPPAAV